MAVLALDLDLRECRARQIAVAVHIDGRVAVLAEHSAFGVAGPGFLLMVQIILDEEVILRVQLGAACHPWRCRASPYGNSMMPW